MKRIDQKLFLLDVLAIPPFLSCLAVWIGWALPWAWGQESFITNQETTPKIWTVALDGTGQFTSIQEAIDFANSGDTIFINPGRYEEDVTVHSKDGLKVLGAGVEQVLIAGLNRVGTLHIGKWPYGATNVEISGMSIQEHGGLGVGIFNGGGILLKNLRVDGLVFGQQVQDVRIENCVVGKSETTGLAFADSQAVLIGNVVHDNDHGVSVGGNSIVRLERNIIKRSLFEAVLVTDKGRATLVQNTLVNNGGGVKFQDDSQGTVTANIIDESRVGIAWSSGNALKIEHNGLHNNQVNYQVGDSPIIAAEKPQGFNDVYVPPLFIAPEQGDYRLQANSPLQSIANFAFLGALPPVKD